MAFKKTQGGSAFVSPVGIPNLSGFKEAARQYSQLGDMAFQIGTDVRERNYNNAILQAEADGRTSGVRYEIDKDGNRNLVPLTNLDYAKASEQYSESEQRGILEAYRKAAIGAYTAHAINQVDDMATKALTENPNNPEAIRAQAQGYFKHLRQSDADIFSALAPKAEALWLEVENRANAQLQIDTKNDQIADLLTSYKNNDRRLENIARKSPGTDPYIAEGISQITDELGDEQARIISDLETLGVDRETRDSLVRGSAIKMVTSAAEAHIERHYIGGGSYADSLSEIDRMKSQIQSGEEDIDADAVEQAMINRLNRLEKVSKQEIVEDNKVKSEITSDTLLSIVTGGDVTISSIQDLPIDASQKYSLLQVLSGYNQQEETKRQQIRNQTIKLYDDQFDRQMVVMSDEFADPSSKSRASAIIDYLWQEGRLKPTNYQKYITAKNNDMKRVIASKADLGLAYLEREMGPDGNYAVHPDVYRQETQELIKKGIIGDQKGQISLTQWEAKVNKYQKERNSFLAKGNEAYDSKNRLKNGDNYTKKDVETVQKLAPALIADEEGNTLYHKDPNTREQNLVKAINFTHAFGALHPDVQSSLLGLSNTKDEDDFNVKMSLFDTLFDSYAKGSVSMGTTELGMGEMNALDMFRKHGIDPTEFEVARLYGFAKWRDMSKISESVSSDRILRNLENTYPDLETAIAQNFNPALEGSGWGEWFTNTLNPFWDTPDVEVLTAMDKLLDTAPDRGLDSGSLDQAYLNDPRLSQAVIMGVKKQFHMKNIPVDQKGLQIAIRNTVLEIADSVGISIDSAGNPYWTTSPWYKEARSSMGDMAGVIQGGGLLEGAVDFFTGIDVDKYKDRGIAGAVFADIRARYNMIGGLADLKVRELLDNDGVMFLVPNTTRGINQTYKVMIRDKDDPYNTAVVLPNYKYDYATSIQNAGMKAALRRTQNDTLINFIKHVPLLGGYFQESSVKNELLEITSDATRPDSMERAMDVMARVVGIVNPELADTMPYRYDEKDIYILRGWLDGRFDDEEFIKELDTIYEQ